VDDVLIAVAMAKGNLRGQAGARHRGPLKPCPFQPCPSENPKRWLACEYHWSFASPQHRAGNKKGAREDHWRWVYSTVCGLVEVASILDSAGVPKPWETELRSARGDVVGVESLVVKARHYERATCACDWCAPLYRWALKVAGVSEESWQKALVRYAP
jgi:hypothetical protein